MGLRTYDRCSTLVVFLGLGLLMTSCSMSDLAKPRDGKALAGRVAVVYSKDYGISLMGIEKIHPFDIRKYDKIYRGLERDSLVKEEEVFVPPALTDEQMRTIHTEAFLMSLESSREVASYLEAPVLAHLPNALMRRGVITPLRRAAGGTIVAAHQALKLGVGINIAGGYHHAKPNKGEGFCVFADIPIAIKLLRAEGKIKRALVIDLDVHQGNGTIVCLKGDEQSYTFSIHQGDIYPNPKEKGDLMTVKACLQRKVPVVVTLGGGYSKNAWQAQYLSLKGIITETTKK